jgi:plasmid stabilization system protein ParE
MRVIWSLQASRQLRSIKTYLLEKWSQNEINNFLLKIKRFERFVTGFPRLYPASLKHPNIRKAVITKHQSILYEIDNDLIRVHTILDHRQHQ